MNCLLLSLAAVSATAAAGAPAAPDSFRAYQAQIAAAEKSLRLNETRELRRWLEAADGPHRGWEWDYLDAIANTAERVVETSRTPSRVTMSPAGDMIATVEESIVRLLSWPALEPVGEIAGHFESVYRAEFGPEGKRLITVSRDITSRTWDVATGRELAHIELANPAFAAATLSPDGRTAATCGVERADGGVHGLVWLWDPASGEVRQRTRVGVKPLSSIRFTPDSQRILTGSWDGLVHVLDADAAEIARFQLPDDNLYNAVNDIGLSPDGRLVAAASKDHTTRVFQVESGELVATLRGHVGFVESVAFSPDGELLATTSRDTTVRLWRTSDWTSHSVLRGAGDTVGGAAWSADGSTIAACANDRRLLVWDVGVDDDAHVDIGIGRNGIYSAAFSPDGASIAVACFDGHMSIFDAGSGELAGSWAAHPESTCHAAAYCADGSRLVTCSWDKTARVWDGATHREIAKLDVGRGVYAATISPDGAMVALSTQAMEVWSVAGASAVHVLAIDGATPTRLAFSPDGAAITSGWTDGRARVHDAVTGELIATLGRDSARVETVAFAADGAYVVTGDQSGVVRMFPAAGGDAAFACDTGGRAVNQVAVHGDRIAASTDHLFLIDTGQGEVVLDLNVNAGSLWHLSWSADGRRIAVGAIPGLVRVFGR